MHFFNVPCQSVTHLYFTMSHIQCVNNKCATLGLRKLCHYDVMVAIVGFMLHLNVFCLYAVISTLA